MSVRVTGAPEFILVGLTPGSGWQGLRRLTDSIPDRCDRAFKLRRASKPRPGDVFLVLGDLKGAGDVRFEDLAEVTWCNHAPYAHDLAYRPVRWRK